MQVPMIAATRCDQCLFSKNRIVSAKRAADIVAECEREDKFFICHKATLRDSEAQVCCRGFFDAHPGVGAPLRLAISLGVAEFVDPSTGRTTGEKP